GRQRHPLDVAGGNGSGRGGRARAARGGALDVLGDHSALGACSLERSELDSALARNPACERRGLDARTRAVALRRLTDLSDLLGSRRLAAALTLRLARGAGRSFLLRGLLDLLRRRGLDGRDVLALLTNDRDRRAHVGVAFCDRDLEQDAGGLGLDLLGHLVGVELVERLALLDLVALGLEPLDDRPGLHALAETREFHFVSHAHSGPVSGIGASGACPCSGY